MKKCLIFLLYPWIAFSQITSEELIQKFPGISGYYGYRAADNFDIEYVTTFEVNNKEITVFKGVDEDKAYIYYENPDTDPFLFKEEKTSDYLLRVDISQFDNAFEGVDIEEMHAKLENFPSTFYDERNKWSIHYPIDFMLEGETEYNGKGLIINRNRTSLYNNRIDIMSYVLKRNEENYNIPLYLYYEFITENERKVILDIPELFD